MAEYKYRQHVLQSDSSVFDIRHAPGTLVANPGIYRCAGCGDEIAICKSQKLPAHPHAEGEKKVEWHLLVFAQQRK